VPLKNRHRSAGSEAQNTLNDGSGFGSGPRLLVRKLPPFVAFAASALSTAAPAHALVASQTRLYCLYKAARPPHSSETQQPPTPLSTPPPPPLPLLAFPWHPSSSSSAAADRLGNMCGGAIISEFIPHRGAKRGLCAEDIWPHAAADFDDLLHAHAHAHGHDDDDFAAAASFHPDQGTHVRLLSVNSTNDDDQPCTQRS
jgi:hypothetical protein